MTQSKGTLDEEKCAKILESLLALFKEEQPTIGEVLLVYGNLGYCLGASIEGLKEKGPGLEELSEMYLKNKNNVGIALMLEGITITSWLEGHLSTQVEKDKGENNETVTI